MYTRQARSTATRPQTVEVAITFTPEELERLDAAVRQSGSELSSFVQDAALEAAHLKIPGSQGRGGNVDAGWLTEAFQETPKNTFEVTKRGCGCEAELVSI